MKPNEAYDLQRSMALFSFEYAYADYFWEQTILIMLRLCDMAQTSF